MADVNNIQDGASESGGLSYQMEQPDRGLELDMSALPPAGVSMGGDTATNVLAGSDPNQGGEQGGMNAMQGLDGLGSRFFNDGADNRVFEGMDSLVGVAGLSGIHGEILADASMYGVQESLPMPEVPETASPLIEPDEH